ncbi:DNA polymerase III subunit beta [Faecalibacterium prausnitzii]|nr:DNA polymerase III subunit beta [Faecalibacterium prausnitzii]
MKFERSEIGALFSKLRTAVPEVRAVGNDSTGILLSGPDAFATNLELSIRAELSSPVPQGVVIPPRGVDFISGAVAPEININVTKSGLVIESGTARARLSTTPAENYPTFDGPGKDAKRCVVSASDLSWAISKVLYAVSKEDRHPAHKGLCFSHNGDDTLEICALDGYRMAISRIGCTADGDFKFVLPAATAKAIDTLGLDGSVSIERDRKKAVFSDNNFEVKSRLIAEPFLDYSKIAAQKSEGTRIVLDRKELLGVLGRVKLARSADAKEKSTLVMDLEPGGTGRASMRSTIAQMNEEFSFNGKLDERLRIGFNLEFLSEALKSMEGDEVSAWVVGPLSPVKLIEPQYEALVLPVKVKEEA